MTEAAEVVADNDFGHDRHRRVLSDTLAILIGVIMPARTDTLGGSSVKQVVESALEVFLLSLPVAGEIPL